MFSDVRSRRDQARQGRATPAKSVKITTIKSENPNEVKAELPSEVDDGDWTVTLTASFGQTPSGR